MYNIMQKICSLLMDEELFHSSLLNFEKGIINNGRTLAWYKYAHTFDSVNLVPLLSPVRFS